MLEIVLADGEIVIRPAPDEEIAREDQREGQDGNPSELFCGFDRETMKFQVLVNVEFAASSISPEAAALGKIDDDPNDCAAWIAGVFDEQSAEILEEATAEEAVAEDDEEQDDKPEGGK